MTSYNFSVSDAFNLYIKMFTNISALVLIAAVVIIYCVILLVNIKKSSMNYIFIIFNILVLLFLIANYGNDTLNNIDSFFDTNILKNIYFYYFNSMIYLCMSTSILKSKRIEDSIKSTSIFLYGITLINLLATLYMSYIVHNEALYVIGNTYPMYFFGNITMFLTYGLWLLYWLFVMKKVRKHRFENRF